MSILLPAEQFAQVRQLPPEQQVRLARSLFASLPQPQQEHVARVAAWASSHLAEPGRRPLQTDRGVALLVVGPPALVHREPARDWGGRIVPRFPGLPALREALTGEFPAPPEARRRAVTLAGPLPSVAWVRPDGSGGLRVLWFADHGGSGNFHLVASEIVAADAVVSEVEPEVPFADLFELEVLSEVALPPVEVAELPELTRDAVPLQVVPIFFKASQGRTFTRFLVTVPLVDVELEFDEAPAAYLKRARLWLRVERDGSVIYQESRALTLDAAAARDGFLLTELSVPLPAGEMTRVVLLADEAGRGGRAAASVQVPDLHAEGLALSSLIVGLAVGTGDAAVLPQAASAGAGGPMDEAIDYEDFQVGHHVIRPTATSAYRRGTTVALAVQAYNAKAAVLEFDVYHEGSYQGTMGPVRLEPLPSMEIRLIDVADSWPDGTYRVVVSAVEPDGGDRKVVQEASFRVRG